MISIKLRAEAPPGANLEWAIRDAIEIAWLAARPVTLVFNGVELEIQPCSTVDELRTIYSRQTEDWR